MSAERLPWMLLVLQELSMHSWETSHFGPKPVIGDHQDAGLWRIFEDRYLIQSQLAWNAVIREQGLPLQFIRGVKVEAERRRGMGKESGSYKAM